MRGHERVSALLRVLRCGMPPAVQKRLVPRIVGGTDLMAALRQSIAESEGEDKAASTKPAAVAVPPKAKKVGKRNPDQRELLLPIAGSGKGKEAAKEAGKKPSAALGRRKAGDAR